MKLTDIISRINISIENINFQPKDNSWSLAAEYLSLNINSKHDTTQLKKLSTLLTTATENQLEKYIVEEIQGFTMVNHQPFAYVGGAHNLSVSLLLEWSSKYIYFYHPNTKELSEQPLQIDELRAMKKQCKGISDILNPSHQSSS